MASVLDGATVPIYYEGRLAKIELPAHQKPVIDAEFEEVTEGEEIARREIETFFPPALQASLPPLVCFEIWRFLRDHVPGFEGSRILSILAYVASAHPRR